MEAEGKIKNQIVITHYVNPHKFWYKPFRVGNRNKQQRQLEDAIDEYCEQRYYNQDYGPYEPILGEVVAAFDPVRERWLRYSVDKIYEFKGQTKYRLWSIDEGMPKDVARELLKPLPENFHDKSTSSVKRGALKNILPSHNVFDPIEEMLSKRMSPIWNSFANTTMKSFIEGAQYICYENVANYTIGGETIDFGNLLFFTTSKSFSAVTVLSEAGLGMIVESSNFISQISETNVLSSSRSSSVVEDSPEQSFPKYMTPPQFADVGEKGQNQISILNGVNERDFDESVSMIGVQQIKIIPTPKAQPVANNTLAVTVEAPNSGTKKISKLAQKIHGLRQGSKNASPITQPKEQQVNTIVTIPKAKETPSTLQAVQPSPQQHSGVQELKIVSPNQPGEPIRNDPNSLTIDVCQSEKLEYALMHASIDEPAVKQTCATPPNVVEIPQQQTPRVDVNPTGKQGRISQRYNLKNRIALAKTKQNKENRKEPEPESPVPLKGFAPAGVSLESIMRKDLPEVATVQSNGELKRFEKMIQEEKCIFSRQTRYRVLVHGAKVPKPIDSITSANFSPNVHHALEQLGISNMHRLQAYSWPHIMRGNSFLCVNTAATGKTFAYLPAVCSVVQRHIEEAIVPPVSGPVCIIICYTSREVQRIGFYCRKLLRTEANSHLAVHECYGVRNVLKTCNLLFNSCAILITTAPCYRRLYERMPEAFVRKRIQTVVIDNIEEILPHFGPELQLLCKNCDQQGLQMIVTAGHWLSALVGFFRRYNNMIICIGAFFEAAVYAKAAFHLRLGRGSERKQLELIKYIKQHDYRTERTIVFGNDSADLETIGEALRQNSINHVVCSGKMVMQKHAGFQSWDQQVRGDMVVLVCCDELQADLNIAMAQHIIHFSLPPTWSSFTRRFACSFDYYECPYLESVSTDKGRPTTLVLLNENNNQQLPKLIDFLELHKTPIPQELVMLAQNIRSHQERTRVLDGRAVSLLCTHVLGFAGCRSSRSCVYRHVLTVDDLAPMNVPTDGRIKVKIAHVFSPVHFAVRLEGHRLPGSTTWKVLHDSERYTLQDFALQVHFANEERHQMYGVPKRNELCAVFYEQNYWRCRIINFEELNTPDNIGKVQLLLLDIGRIVHVNSSALLLLPEKFRDLSGQTIDVRIAGVIPHDFEQDWDKSATNMAREWIKKYESKPNCHIEGNVLLALRDTIWVDELYLVEQLEDLKTTLVTEKIRATIIAKQFGIADKESFVKVSQLVRDCEALRILPESDSKEMVHTEAQEEPQEAAIDEQLAEDCFSMVDKHGNIPSDDEEMQKPELTQAVSGLQPSVLANSIANEEEIHLPSPEETTERRPSESFEMLPPTQEKDEESQHQFDSLIVNTEYSVVIGRYYSPDNFYVFRSEKLREVQEQIEKFTGKKTNLTPLTNPHAGQYCLVFYENMFQRGRLVAKANENTDQKGLDVFFLDFGGILTCYLEELYTIPDHLLCRLPFLAIKGSFAFIQPTTGTSWTEEVSNKIYDDVLEKYNQGNMLARVIRPKYSQEGAEQPIEGCRWYELLLFEANSTNLFGIVQDILFYELAICSIDEQENPLDLTDCDDDEESLVQVNFTNEEMLQILMQQPIQKRDGDVTKSIDEPARIVEISDEEAACMSRSPSRMSVSTEGNSSVRPALGTRKRRATKASASTTGRGSSVPAVVLPRLNSDYRFPQVVWQQDDFFVVMRVNAPDVARYDLTVDIDALLLKFVSGEGESYLLPLNLFGPVEPQHTTHEIRGLMIVIRLLKLVPTIGWPTLLNHTSKVPWLKEATSVDGSGSGSDDMFATNRWKQMLPVKMDDPCDTVWNESDDAAGSDSDDMMEDKLFLRSG
ncbi:uncharacterized protein LOC128730136 [Anopheles nili]|uniref:uncharacterized protein LOC128730136 n=1 Tax=Anopheles nili TaxID=185578 RepID=UPI00237A77F7|nr:uncharacterized protein LOC128730136 [Anopheles nili]